MTKGRKRKKGITRDKNGRIQRTLENKSTSARLTEAENLRPAIDARQRHYNVSEIVANRPTTGYMLGRLLESGISDRKSGISQIQHDAALMYAEIKADYLRSIEPPHSAKAVNLNPMPGMVLHLEDEAQHIKRVQRCVTAYMSALTVIKCADLLGETAINKAIDEQMINIKELGALRISLNALGKFFRSG